MTKGEGEAFAFTCPLIKKADGGKFGKTEKGNVWLDPNRTSPYQFYQFWLNATDEDARSWIKIFTFLSKTEIDELTVSHDASPHLRLLQKKLAESLTILVHSQEDYEFAVKASDILFGNATTEALQSLTEQQLLQVMDGVPTVEVEKQKLNDGIDAISFLAETSIYPSKGEARKALQANGVSFNKQKAPGIDMKISSELLLNDKYLLVQKGKKNYYLVIAE
jgi:tyrosyl-tRNA synthetase